MSSEDERWEPIYRLSENLSGLADNDDEGAEDAGEVSFFPFYPSMVFLFIPSLSPNLRNYSIQKF